MIAKGLQDGNGPGHPGRRWAPPFCIWSCHALCVSIAWVGFQASLPRKMMEDPLLQGKLGQFRLLVLVCR
jgi:hypothetical protein